MQDQFLIDRRSGVAAWKQIADRLSGAIAAGDYDETGMVPPETQLAERFGVNRHTVRSAIAALAEEGILRRVQGRGTLIEKRDRLVYPIGRRTRFSEGLEGQAGETGMQLLSVEALEAPGPVTAALGLAPGADVVCLRTLSSADGVPVSLAVHCFDRTRFGGIAEAFDRSRSITRALAELGIRDYVRSSTEVAARMATADEARLLALGAHPIVLDTEAVNADAEGRPIQHSRTLFAAERIVLRLDTAAG